MGKTHSLLFFNLHPLTVLSGLLPFKSVPRDANISTHALWESASDVYSCVAR